VCGECGIRQSSCIILKYCVGSVAYVSQLYYIKVLCGECGILKSSCNILKYCVGSVVNVSLVVLYKSIVRVVWYTSV